MDPRFLLVDERAAVWNGRPVDLTLSAESATGYLNVCYQAGRSKPYYVKAKVDDGKPRTIPGSYSTTAWEAAAKYAYFKALWEGPLPEKQERSKRSSAEVSARPSAASSRSAFTCRLFVAGDDHQARGKEGQEGGEAGGKSRQKGRGERRAGSGRPGHTRAAVRSTVDRGHLMIGHERVFRRIRTQNHATDRNYCAPAPPRHHTTSPHQNLQTA